MADQVLSVLGFLTNNLSTFVKEEGQLLGGLRQEVQLISDEFGHMKAFLQVLNSCNEDDPQLAEWTRQVREAADDTEDVLAEFMLLFARQRHPGFSGFVRSTFISLKNLPARHGLATKLQSIKARIHNISEARRRYLPEPSKIPAQVSGFLPATSDWKYNKDDKALYEKEDQLVGIDKPKQHLLSQILGSHSPLKVVAVLGMGGIGKTTLVKRVHSDAAVVNRFRIRAWVTVSQTYDLKELLKVLIRRLHASFKESAPPSGVDSMSKVSAPPSGVDSMSEVSAPPSGVDSMSKVSAPPSGVDSMSEVSAPPSGVDSMSKVSALIRRSSALIRSALIRRLHASFKESAPPSGVDSMSKVSAPPSGVDSMSQVSAPPSGLDSMSKVSAPPSGVDSMSQVSAPPSGLDSMSQVSAPPSGLDSMSIEELKGHIRDFLRQARYAIVFDDVWRTDFWDACSSVLTENSYGGNCVILTTRIAYVASSCTINPNDVFIKDYLTSQESMTLFCRKTFKDDCCPPHLKGVVESILEKCDGLPLAIMAISGVLVTKNLNRIDEWEQIRSGLGHEFEGARKLDTAKKILSLSYDDLPHTLKTFLLYTSIFPEDYEIECLFLIGLWIAERFVAEEAGPGIEEVGWNYVKELANRSLIQLGEIDYDGLPEKFQIHDLLREVIVSEAMKINFMTVIGTTQRRTIIWPPAEKKVRRLVFHGNDSFHNFVPKQSHKCFNRLQSIITFDCTEPPSKSVLSELLSNKFLKVVNFKGMQLEKIPKEIFNLFHLTRLSLRGSKVKRVPKTIKRLKNLEYLNLTETLVRKLPVEILKLQKLRHLYIYELVDFSDWDLGWHGFKAPGNMGSLLALEALDSIDAAESDKTKIITEIGKLTQLRELDITNLRSEDGKELCSSIEKLVNLQELRIASSIVKDEEVIVLNLCHHIFASSVLQSICFLHLNGRLENMPPWISDLQNLGKINLIRSSLRDDPLESLQHLPNLIDVILNQAYEGESLCFKSGGFQKLRKLRLRNMKGLRRMRVEGGAMPHIKELYLDELPLMEEVPSGVEHLRELQELEWWGMNTELMNKLKKGSEDYNKKRIEHIPKVYIDGWRIEEE